jgi:hypothetical protein
MNWLKRIWDFVLYWLKQVQDSQITADPVPIPEPQPDPVPLPEPIPDPIPLTEIVICDLATLPEQMRADGILLGDSSIWYGVACAWAGHGWTINDETMPIYEVRDRIQGWFEALIQHGLIKLRNNPNLTATAIAGDGRDRCGFLIGPAIMERFKEFGDRVQPGTVVPESEY